MPKKPKPQLGRPRIASKAPISITLTDPQRDWLLAQVPEGGTLTELVRALVQDAMQRGANPRTLAALESLKDAALDYAKRVK